MYIYVTGQSACSRVGRYEVDACPGLASFKCWLVQVGQIDLFESFFVRIGLNVGISFCPILDFVLVSIVRNLLICAPVLLARSSICLRVRSSLDCLLSSQCPCSMQHLLSLGIPTLQTLLL